MKESEAIKVLEDCEQNLRRLVAEAVKDGDYVGVLRITDWARAVSALAGEGRSNESAIASDPDTKPEVTRHSAAPAPLSLRSKTGRDVYPKFYRRADELVKVGWSKKDRREYNHRAGRNAVDAVAAAIRQFGIKGKMFTGDKLLPLKNAVDGSRIADYQAYVALAWFKHLGIVQQHGRKSGYTLAPGKQIESTITAAWPELTEWRG